MLFFHEYVLSQLHLSVALSKILLNVIYTSLSSHSSSHLAIPHLPACSQVSSFSLLHKVAIPVSAMLAYSRILWQLSIAVQLSVYRKKFFLFYSNPGIPAGGKNRYRRKDVFEEGDRGGEGPVIAVGGWRGEEEKLWGGPKIVGGRGAHEKTTMDGWLGHSLWVGRGKRRKCLWRG